MSAVWWVIKKILKVLLYTLIVLFLIAAFLIWRTPVLTPKTYGITFAPWVATWFGNDPREVYRAILDDLHMRHIRIVAYWTEVERERGVQNFEVLDWQVADAEERDAKLIFAIGRKVPRWPECHIPNWVLGLSKEEQDQELYRYLRIVVERYKDSPAIEMWQVENEPYLPFGECPYDVSETLDEEIKVVKSIDPLRRVLTTDSGELSLWVHAARRGDAFGTTMYRRVFNRYFGEFEYPIPPAFFRLKRALTELVVGEKQMMVIELQGEPWLEKPIIAASIEEQYRSMDPVYFKDMLEYASRSGFDIFYLWGVEWWYWLKTQGHPEIWDIMRGVVKSMSSQ